MTDTFRPVRRALISVSDKTGLETLARGLGARGVQIVSTGATAGVLRGHGLDVTEVAEVTGHPEILGGRVKTLHPKIHGGLLGKPDDIAHRAEMAAHGIAPFDLIAVNLYPFERTLASGAPFDAVVEEIDVGGPAMLRAAAKNHASVAVLSHPGQYAEALHEIAATGGTSGALRRRLAGAAFARTAAYDAAIAEWLTEGDTRGIVARRVGSLRYGENPHQAAALYATEGGGIAGAAQAQGKLPSYNNILDADAALALVAEFAEPACVIVKHATPCGAGIGATLAEAHGRALACDPESAFGGIVAVNRPLDEATARAILTVFTEVVVAPDADEAARAALAGKPGLRLMLVPDLGATTAPVWRQVSGGFLVQDRDAAPRPEFRVMGARAPSAAEEADLRLAWTVVKHVRSNAIVLAAGGGTVGIGGGQTSRVESVRIAAHRMARMATPPAGAVLASDAFFPFADGVEAAAAAGVTAIVQPGGSKADAEVTAAADRHGIAMVATGVRHFRH